MLEALRQLAVTQFSDGSVYRHYVSIAKKSFREHSRGEVLRYKKYFYVPRFADLAEATLTDARVIAHRSITKRCRLYRQRSSDIPPPLRRRVGRIRHTPEYGRHTRAAANSRRFHTRR